MPAGCFSMVTCYAFVLIGLILGILTVHERRMREACRARHGYSDPFCKDYARGQAWNQPTFESPFS